MTKTLPAYLLFLFVLFSSFAISFGQNTLSGRITNDEGEPLSFANIVVTHSIEKGVETLVKSQNGTTSDIDGCRAIDEITLEPSGLMGPDTIQTVKCIK